MVVLEREYFNVPEEMLARQQVQITTASGEIAYIAENATQMFSNTTAKFPNYDQCSVVLERNAIGGLDRKQLSRAGAARIAKKKKKKKKKKKMDCAHHR